MNAVSASRSHGHLRRCRSASGAHVRPQSPGNASYLPESPSTLHFGSCGALHLTIPEQAPTSNYKANYKKED
jgi:hypothetical protein